jgi:hypothetical protein
MVGKNIVQKTHVRTVNDKAAVLLLKITDNKIVILISIK